MEGIMERRGGKTNKITSKKPLDNGRFLKKKPDEQNKKGSLFDQRLPGYPPLFLSWTALVLVIVYATWNSGLAGDDFVLLNRGLSIPIWDDLLPAIHISVPFMHYLLAIPYHVIGDAFWGYGVLKALYLCFSAYAVFQFFSKFTSCERAFLGMLVFVLSPIHDAATLWLMGQYLMISMGCYLLAYVFAADGKIKIAIFLALAASFSSYGSPPLAIFLGGIFVWRREFKNACVMIIPNLIYTAYYIGTSVFLKLGAQYAPTAWDWSHFAKSYAMQILSYGDAAIGPSAILKTMLAINSMGAVSIALAGCFALILWQSKTSEENDRRPPSIVLVFALIMVLIAFGLFAVTWGHPQVAFSLGNRVTIFGNFLLALLAMRWFSKRLLAGIAIIVCAAFLGLGDHWSRWNETVLTSISNIRNNAQLASLAPERMLFVKGLQYSPLGPMAHIDHFKANYVIREVFRYAMQTTAIPRTASLNRSMDLVEGELWDRKFGTRYPISKSINVYDAAANRLDRVDASNIQATLDNLPAENRHWVQLLGPGRIRDTIVWLMPGVSYAFRSP